MLWSLWLDYHMTIDDYQTTRQIPLTWEFNKNYVHRKLLFFLQKSGDSSAYLFLLKFSWFLTQIWGSCFTGICKHSTVFNSDLTLFDSVYQTLLQKLVKYLNWNFWIIGASAYIMNAIAFIYYVSFILYKIDNIVFMSTVFPGSKCWNKKFFLPRMKFIEYTPVQNILKYVSAGFGTLKLVSAIFCQIFIFSSKDRPSKTMKNVFYFI